MKHATTVMSTQEPIIVDADYPERGVTRGAIVNIGSTSSLVGVRGESDYVGSKHAISGMTKSAGMC